MTECENLFKQKGGEKLILNLNSLPDCYWQPALSNEVACFEKTSPADFAIIHNKWMFILRLTLMIAQMLFICLISMNLCRDCRWKLASQLQPGTVQLSFEKVEEMLHVVAL